MSVGVVVAGERVEKLKCSLCSRLNRKLLVTISREVTFACNFARLLARQMVFVSSLAGKSGMITLSYSPSTASKNQIRPLCIGPDKVKRGSALSSAHPFLL